MKNSILVVCTIINVLVTVIALIFVFKVDVAWTGPLGDTFGGLLSPIIGSISIYFIYKTFTAQREQLKDQRNQHYVSRLTEVIYSQLDRIDQSIKSVVFIFVNPIEPNAQGYRGLFIFNESIKQAQVNLGYLPDDLRKNSHILIGNNISQLTEIYDKVAAAVVIIDNLLSDYNLDSSKNRDLVNLLLLNLGESVRDNVEQINEFVNWHAANSTYLDSIWVSEIHISRLRQLVYVVQSFYEKSLSNNHSI